MILRTARLITHRSSATAEPVDREPARQARVDLIAAGIYLMLGLYISARLWRDLDHRMVEINSDQSQFYWFLEHAVRVVTQGADPFFTHALNVPDGVNLMANTAALGLTLPMVPVTVLFGAPVSFAVLIVLGLSSTAFGWYWLFSRHLVEARWAAALGGGFCGFAPGMVSQANGHVNWTAQVLVPFILLAVIKQRGVILGFLIAYQAFINEEVLLYTALACAVFFGAYAALTWPTAKAQVKPMLKALGIAAAISVVLLAYPLYRQFFGGQTYAGLPVGVAHFKADLAAYPAFSRLSFGGVGPTNLLSWNISEETSFFGWPLLLVTVALVLWLWRSTLIRALAVTAGVFFVFSLGSSLMVGRRGTGIPLPWYVLGKLPLLHNVLPVRFALVLVPIVGALLAIGVERVIGLTERFEKVPVRRFAGLALVAALLPILPVPIPVRDQAAVPEFISSGTWRAYVPSGQTLVAVPVTSEEHPAAMVWQAATGAAFPIAGGYFIGPDGLSGRGRFGAVPRPTAELWRGVYKTGRVPEVTAQMRQSFAEDAGYWKASVVVLPDAQRANHEPLRLLLDKLAGPGWHVQDVLLWQIPAR